jgi:hypothetical protein
MQIFNKTASEKENVLGFLGDFGKIIDVVHRKLCLLSVQMGNSSLIEATG